jgi:hypothetical protein
MVVEDGRPLLISNLQLTNFSGGMEFFRLFPAARALKLSTALRMNAAFPYVTPAVNLPTKPLRRVVDAGYLDNYGVGLVADWLMRHRDWLKKNTSRVILIQIRAYPIDLDHPSQGPIMEAVRNAFQPVTTPPEGYSAGRWAAMRDYMRARVDAIEESLNADRGRLPLFRPFELECEEVTPLSWTLTNRDRVRLAGALKRKQKDIDQIVRFLKDE